MKFSVDKDQLLRSLNYCQGVIEKRSTLPILSNVLLNDGNSNLTVTAKDLDLIFKYADFAVDIALNSESGLIGLDENMNKIRCIPFNEIKGGKPFNPKQEWFVNLLKTIELI